MSRTPSPRHRPNFHLSLTPLLGTPNQIYQATPPGQTPFSTPHVSPFGLTTYSPFRSAGLRPPTPYGGSVQFTPKPQRKANSVYGSYTLFRLKRICTSRALVLLIVVVVGFFWWWRAGLGSEIKVVKVGRTGFGLGSQLVEPEATKDLQFFPAANPKIHVRRPFVVATTSKLTGRSIAEDGHRLQTGFEKMEPFLVIRSTWVLILVANHIFQASISMSTSPTPQPFSYLFAMPSKSRDPVILLFLLRHLSQYRLNQSTLGIYLSAILLSLMYLHRLFRCLPESTRMSMCYYQIHLPW